MFSFLPSNVLKVFALFLVELCPLAMSVAQTPRSPPVIAWVVEYTIATPAHCFFYDPIVFDNDDKSVKVVLDFYLGFLYTTYILLR